MQNNMTNFEIDNELSAAISTALHVAEIAAVLLLLYVVREYFGVAVDQTVGLLVGAAALKFTRASKKLPIKDYVNK